MSNPSVSPDKNPRFPWNASVFVILVVGCFFRLWNLDVHSFWHDEGATLYLATAQDPLEALRGSRHPPVAIFAFRYWFNLFGEGDAMARLLPALVSCGSLVLFINIAKRWCERPAALLAAALYAVAPFQLWYAGEVTPYAFLEFGSLLTLSALSDALLKAKIGWSHCALLVLGPAMAFGSHYMGWLVGMTVACCATIAYFGKRLEWRSALVLPACAAGGGMLWIPWLLTIFREQQKTIWGNEAKLAPREILELPTRLLLIDMSVVPAGLQVAGYAMGAIIYIGLFAHVVKLFRRRRIEDACLVAGVAAPLAGALGMLLVMPPNFLPRYLTAAAPALACVVASGLIFLYRWRVGVALGAILFAGLASISAAQKLQNRREDYRTGCLEIMQQWKPGDRVFVVTGTPDPFAEAPVRHYLRDRPEIMNSISHIQTGWPPREAFAPGTRLHVLYREKIYSRDIKNSFDRAATLVDQSEDRFGIRRLAYEVIKK